MPCIEDAWNFPISQEMASRQNAFQRQNQGLLSNDDAFNNKRQKTEPGVSRIQHPQGNSQISTSSNVYLNSQQMQLMNFLQQNQVRNVIIIDLL